MPPQDYKVPIVEGGNDILVISLELTNRETREALLGLARVVTTQLNMSMETRKYYDH